MSDPTAKAAAEFQAAEKEAASIRTALRKIGAEPSAIEEENSLKIEWKELQLSSPIEDTQISGPGESHTFHGVAVGQATLTCHAANNEVKDSDTHDVMEFTTNLLKPLAANALTNPLTSQLTVTVTEDTKIVLETIYTPSSNDVRSALYELLNAATQRKAIARDALAKSSSKPKSSVPAGFLNAKSSASKPPSSWAVAGAAIVTWGPRVKNYVLFGAFCLLANYRGHWLAIPAPV